ncbi:MAG: chemotaxis protein CheA, partial [Candidatus Electrothrix sp. AR3]|nr:chemotaxis protein CheA [Candidatus Electrothrix sp. AR3]
TVELSISVDKQDVLYRCSDSIKSLKSSANYMGYEKLAQHYSNWQQEITTAVDQLSSGKIPDLAFMQNYIDEIIRSFPQAMDGYTQDDPNKHLVAEMNEEASVESALDSIFSDDTPIAVAVDEPGQTHDLDIALDSIFSDASPSVGEEPEAFVPQQKDSIAAPQATISRAKPSQQTKIPPSLPYELSDDEYDQELVSIFIKKLKTDICFIREQTKKLGRGTEDREILERCHDAIGRLASSANYMDYLSLTAYCEQWCQAVADDIANLAEGLQVDHSYLTFFIQGILNVYPQVDKAEQPREASLAAKNEPEDTSIQDVEFEDATDTVVSLLSTPQYDSTEHPVLKKKKDDSLRGEPKEDDQELFTKLSNALDASMSMEGQGDQEPMDSVIEKFIDTDQEAKSEKALPDPKKTSTNKKISAKLPETEESADLFSGLSSLPEVEIESGNSEEFEEEFEEEEFEEEFEAELEDELVPREEKKNLPEKKEIKSGAQAPAGRSSIRVDAEKIDYLMNQVGELVVSRAYFAQLVNEMKGLQQQLLESSSLTKSELKPLHEFSFRLSEAGVHLGRVSNELQEGVMKVRMLPIDQLFKRYPRLVRDLIHQTKKDVRLVTKGEETELDKMVIESISDPLIHIIRNSVDHGIETVEERKRAGKPAQGTLLLEAFHESDHIVLEITDDGRGIDPKRIKAKALEKKMYRKDELDRMSEPELTRIIMQPGFSTAAKATKTSGRGVGMDVVRKNIEKLNGIVEIDSKPQHGTRLRIKIPLTMAIIQALMVRVGKEKFTIPLTTVEETLRIFRNDISEIEGVDVIHIRDITMPIFRLSRIYDIERDVQEDKKMFVVVVSTGTQEVGLVVDELLGQEEVVIKPLADYLRLESGCGGATILGDGGISLILDIPELVKLAADNQADKQEQRALMNYKRGRRRRRKNNTNDAMEEQEQSVH